MDELLGRWATLVGRTAAAVRHGHTLLDRWSEPHRHYHAVSHLRAVLDALDLLAGEVRSPTVVRLAAWFHDAVYEGRPGDDERASAGLADATLTELGLPPSDVAEVRRLVLLTATHDPSPGDDDGAALCDADLSVLGGTPADYQAYTEAVRRDYAHVPDDAFQAGRAAVLDRLLAHDPLFHTPTGRRLWQTAARRNITAELARLRPSR